MANKKMKAVISTAMAAAMIAAPAAVFAAQDQSAFPQPGSLTAGQAMMQTAESQTTGSGFWNWLKGLFGGQQDAAPGQESQDGTSGTQQGGPGQMGGMPGQMGQMGQTQYASEPTEVVTSTLTSNTAEALTADYANAQTIVMSDENNDVTIKASGTYIITGTCSDGNIKVKKGTQDVVLILKDLDLTSSVGATLSLNKGTETKVIIEGTVKLTDAESLADEESDDFDGAAIKAKAGSAAVLTGSGTLIVNGSCKNGIKVSDTDEDDMADGYSDASFIIDGGLSISVTAANDGMNSGTDLTIKSGTITVSAGDDGIKADYILTIGEEGETGPTINIRKSSEGLEGAILNIYSGKIDVTASDDALNAANSDLTGYTFSVNIMGGTVNLSSGMDGIDSNGNINLLGGLTTIVKAASNGGEGGMDYQGSCYVEDGCLVNPYGVTMDSGMGGMMGGMNQGQMPGQMGGMNQGQMPGQMPSDDSQTAPQDGFGTRPDQMNGQNSQMPGMPGQMGGMNQGQMPGQMGPQGGFGPRPGQMNGQMPGQPPQFGSGEDSEMPEEPQMPDGFRQNVFFGPLTDAPSL
ncbi:MAG: carbohydrate-binding domain-containing protein [Clostridia bacterium]|nr:carbohydrate-binding domain-containing protein [Clostridia bacterium]